MKFKTNKVDFEKDEKFKALVSHFKNQSTAYSQFNVLLKNEIKNHTGHSFGRHGYQTGWEAQVIRVVTGVTPDQSFDPMGLNPSIRTWNEHEKEIEKTKQVRKRVGKKKKRYKYVTKKYKVKETHVNTYGYTGKTIETKLDDVEEPEESDYAIEPGLESGGFLSHTAQLNALTKAKKVAENLKDVVSAHYGKNKERYYWQYGKKHWYWDDLWLNIYRITVVVDAKPSPGYGIGFKRKNTFKNRTRLQVSKLIDHFYNQSTWGEVDPIKYKKTNNKVLEKKRLSVALPNLDDLFDYLGIEAFWQKNCLTVLEWDGNKNDWSLVTMYPCRLAPGWAPSRKVKNCPWTGWITLANNSYKKFSVPPWTPK